MKLILNDEFLNQYKIKTLSNYNDNYYELPFYIECDSCKINILHIRYDEASNEYEYSLGDKCDDYVIDERFIIPSPANDDNYEIDLCNYSKQMIWT